MLINKYVTAYGVTMLFATLLIIVGIPIALHYLQPSIPSAATAYTFPRITTNTKPLCPGQKLVYDQEVHVDYAPVALEVVESVWSIELQKNVIQDHNPYKVNIPHPYTVHGHTEWIIPQLDTGNYELLRSTTAQGRQTQMFAVTFTIAENCKKQN